MFGNFFPQSRRRGGLGNLLTLRSKGKGGNLACFRQGLQARASQDQLKCIVIYFTRRRHDVQYEYKAPYEIFRRFNKNVKLDNDKD
jgi:hypothetical protein